MKGDTVAILGLGLMGGSLARALRERSADARILAWTPDGAEPAEACREGVIDRAARDPREAVREADTVIIAAPVGESTALLSVVSASLKAAAVVTDVCSVKAPIVDAARRAGIADRFCGAHPLCGSHRSGWAASSARLFEGRRVFIVPSLDPRVSERIENFWRGVGAETERIDAGSHDALMARISHLPQILASALAATLAGENIARSRLGPGGIDMTRLAASQPELWADLLLHNGAHVSAALAAARHNLDRFAHAIDSGDATRLHALLEEGNAWVEEGP